MANKDLTMLSSPEPHAAHATFQCRHAGCSQTYQRKEHLNRHMAHHKEGQRFSCPHCNSTLARRNVSSSNLCRRKLTLTSDLLRRHILKYHPDKEPPASRAQKACKSCHVRKERCDGGYPCSQCQRRKVTCLRTRQGTARDEHSIQPTQAILSKDLISDTSPWIGQGCIDIYFEKFHPTWPFLHKPTFHIAQEPCVLIQTMLMIGLWIRGDRTGRDMAMAFHTKLLFAIEEQRFQWYISESTLRREDTPKHMATYQSILLQLIFSLMVTRKETSLDLNLRFKLQDPQYDLLTSLVATCRRLGLFYYPNMLAQHPISAPPPLVWVSVEETKRLGLALYKLCRLCTRAESRDSRNELLTLQDLEFCMPDVDEVWNAPADMGQQLVRANVLQQAGRDNRNPEEWISKASMRLCDSAVGLDWI